MPDFEHAPIKRHEALVPLSRDHFTGLVRAQRLIKSTHEDRVARHKALAGFLDAWNSEIAAHFDDEERLFKGKISGEDEQRLLREHKEIRALAKEAAEMRSSIDPSPERLKRIGVALRDHIRWEERELFGRVEASACEEQLNEMARETAKIEASRPRSKVYGQDAADSIEDG
ncbi:MAG: hemerythrin domain-containing protein [Phycisphaerales bacterium]